ncbi:MAG: ATP synthase F1 subunit gamma [Acidobacteria bacterium]|nr:ATP synthase F1 subunit gamma [Acidobacteriota bacterium]
MPSLIDLRRRIRSVRNTQQITKAMRMVAASKLRRAQDRVIASRPFTSGYRKLLANVVAASSGEVEALSHPLLQVRPEQRIQLILLTSDRGLAGPFNSNLIRGGMNLLEKKQDASVDIEAVGRKGRDFFRRRATLSGEHIGVFDKPSYTQAQKIADKAIGRYTAGQVDAVYLIYNEFRSVISQRLTVTRILPAPVPEGKQTTNYIFEQPPAQLLGNMLPNYVRIMVYGAVLESAAAEQAARMVAMESATTNAGKVIDQLTLHLNRARQAGITKEIIEVVSGANALE